MGFSINTVLVIAVVALAGLVLLRVYLGKSSQGKVPPAAARTPQPQRKPVAKNPFRAVSISAPDNACAAAKALAGKRFLVTENTVPQVPLGECDAADCACTYEHHKDRREEGEERRAPSSLRTQLHSETGNSERRAKRGRRSTDWE